MRTAIYRMHYGFETLYKSINSIYDWADRIIVVVSRIPWYTGETIECEGKIHTIKHPEDIDYHISNLRSIPKVFVEQIEFKSPNNQWGYLVNRYSSELVLTLEPDMVFQQSPHNLEVGLVYDAIACLNQCELWKNDFWRIPLRQRPGPVLFRKPTSITTRLDNFPLGMKVQQSNEKTLNYGFCFSPQLMLYKHLLALGFSKQIGDSLPNESWYRIKWYNWTPETENLEISLGKEHFIKRAILNEKN